MGTHTMFSAGLYVLTENICLDFAPVKVNLISPRAVATEMNYWNPEREAVFGEVEGDVASKKRFRGLRMLRRRMFIV